jgi:SAM-dependent methyltransferase
VTLSITKGCMSDVCATSENIPNYLRRNYWWAYVHPLGVRVFERQWLVNLILWGHFARLRDAALDEFGSEIRGHTLQVACVYGDFSKCLAERLAEGDHLNVVDILPIQLRNLRDKLRPDMRVHLQLGDSAALDYANATYDQCVLFFLLHEQPCDIRRKTLAEALRVLRPGGKLVLIDYHLPRPLHPLRYLLRPILSLLEPYALDLWRRDISEWLPSQFYSVSLRKELFFGGLFQKIVMVRSNQS